MIKNTDIARAFQLATDFETAPMVIYPMILSEKLNGLRCRYIPGDGFYSKKGIKWSAAVLEHLIPDTHLSLDCELYAPGMSLQEITTAVGINRLYPGPRHSEVRLYAFDVFDTKLNGLERKKLVAESHPTTIPYKLIGSTAAAASELVAVSKRDGEGIVLQHPYAPYTAGKTRSCLKLKLFKDGEFNVVGRTEGEGEDKGITGSLTCALPNGLTFSVGSGLTVHDQIVFWTRLPARIKVAYERLSDSGIPLKPRFIAEEL